MGRAYQTQEQTEAIQAEGRDGTRDRSGDVRVRTRLASASSKVCNHIAMETTCVTCGKYRFSLMNHVLSWEENSLNR